MKLSDEKYEHGVTAKTLHVDESAIESLIRNVAEPKTLHPDLEACLKTMNGMLVLHHPLVLMPLYHPMMAEYANKAYEHKQEELAKAEARRDWDRFVFMHERPFRLQALLRAVNRMNGSRKMWQLVRSVWTDSESPSVNHRIWAELFARESAWMMMSNKDLATFNEMSGPLTIYRGVSRKSPRGFSWTLDREMAEWFARRFTGDGHTGRRVLVGKIQNPRQQLVGLFTQRNESEVIVHPKWLRRISVMEEKI